MARITLIVGLPASGKTTFTRSIATADTCIVDDPQSIEELPESFDHLIITDPFLCRTDTRNRASVYLMSKYPMAQIEWLFFENNPVQCLINAKRRQNKNVDALIRHLSKDYLIPENTKTIPVWSSN